MYSKKIFLFTDFGTSDWYVPAVKSKILELWSPEQISGRLKLLYPNDPKMNVSAETIYSFILWGVEFFRFS